MAICNSVGMPSKVGFALRFHQRLRWERNRMAAYHFHATHKSLRFYVIQVKRFCEARLMRLVGQGNQKYLRSMSRLGFWKRLYRAIYTVNGIDTE